MRKCTLSKNNTSKNFRQTPNLLTHNVKIEFREGKEKRSLMGMVQGEEEDDSDEAAPEVGQLMFVGPEQRVVRGEVVRVRVSHGADGFRAALLP